MGIYSEESKRLKMIGSLKALVFGIALALIIGELVARLYFWQTTHRKPTRDTIERPITEHHPRFGWALIPNSETRHYSSEFDTRVSINGQGLRHDRDIPYGRPVGKRRILLLGDSNTFGHGVNIEERFGEKIEKRLRDVEVVNMAVYGTGTDQQLLLYLDEGVKYAADLVILCYGIDNIERNATKARLTSNRWVGKPSFELRDGELILTNVPVPSEVDAREKIEVKRKWEKRPSAGVPIPFKRTLRKHSSLYKLVRTGIPRGLLDTLRTIPMEFPEYEPSRKEWKLTEALFKEFAYAARENGSRFLLIILSASEYHYEIEEDTLPQRLIREMGEREGIAVLDLLPGLKKAYRQGAVLSFALDQHWTPEGHTFAAQVITDYLKVFSWPDSEPTATDISSPPTESKAPHGRSVQESAHYSPAGNRFVSDPGGGAGAPPHQVRGLF